MSPGINDPDTKGPEISPGIKNQEMVLPDRMEISPGIKDQGMVPPDRMETTTPMTGPMKRSKQTMMDIK